MIPYCERCETRFDCYIDNHKEEMFLQCSDCGAIKTNFDFNSLTVAELLDLKEVEYGYD